MTVFYVACLVFGLGFLAWAATFGMRALLRDFTGPLQQPDDSLRPPTGGVVRPQRRVAPSDPTLSAALPPATTA